MSHSRGRPAAHLLPFAVALLAALLVALSLTPAHADQHEDWELYLGFMPGPLTGHCGGELHARGVSFPPNAVVVLGRITASGTFDQFQRIATPEAGWFSEVLSAPYPAQCAPGDTVEISARVLNSTGDAVLGNGSEPFEVRQQVDIRTDQASISLAPAVGSGCIGDTTIVSGSGYQSGATVDIFWGDADPFAHNFASLGTVTVEADGTFEREVDLLFGPCPHDGTQAAINARVVARDDSIPEGGTRWSSAIYTVGAPSPAAAGNANLLHHSTPSRSLQLLLLAATAALVTVGRVVSPGARP